MTDLTVIAALNTLADALNQAAATFEAIGRLPVLDALRMRGDRRAPDIAPGSPLARIVEQGGQFAKTMPKPGKPTTWEPEWPS